MCVLFALNRIYTKAVEGYKNVLFNWILDNNVDLLLERGKRILIFGEFRKFEL